MAEAPVADAMRLVTMIIRGEHFCDGTIGKARTVAPWLLPSGSSLPLMSASPIRA